MTMCDERILVPGPDAEWREAEPFAFSYNAYGRYGTFDEVADLHHRVLNGWRATGIVDCSLEEARCALFFVQREGHWDDSPGWPCLDDMAFVHALLTRIRELAGDSLPGPIDGPP